METLGSAVVTGGGRGIGREIARLLVERGYAVVVTDIDGERARRTAEELGAVSGVAQDIRQEASHAAVAKIALFHGPLTAWFNNAGVGDDGSLMELSSESVGRLVGVNLLGTLWGMRAAIDAFGSRGGDIINTASLSGFGAVPGLSVYAATKAAVVSVTMSVAAETPKNVRVHAISPDGVNTEMVAAMKPDGEAKALVHSGGGLLEASVVAEAAVALIGTRRILRAVPGWRGVVVRATALAPSLVMGAEPVFVWMGRRVMRKAGSAASVSD